MHQCLHEEWQGVLDQHKNRGDTWDAFSAENSQFFPDLPRIGNVTLTGDILYEAIQSTDPGTAAGSDGWKPGELRWLPKTAWDLRAKIANAMLDGKGTPESYEHAYMTAIPKKGKDPKPLHQRMLTIFTALYRVETKAMFMQIKQDFMNRLHPDLYGGVGGKEALEAAWDAQLDIEQALVNKQDLVFLTVDYRKYFDSFDRRFMKKFLDHFGLPENLNAWMHEEYDKLKRATKIGKSVGDAHKYANGYRQGDPLSLLAALAFVSVQFTKIQRLWPELRVGALIDDRNIRGPLDQVLEAHDAMADFVQLGKVLSTRRQRSRPRRKTHYGS